jgi:hypothetical protein
MSEQDHSPRRPWWAPERKIGGERRPETGELAPPINLGSSVLGGGAAAALKAADVKSPTRATESGNLAS